MATWRILWLVLTWPWSLHGSRPPVWIVYESWRLMSRREHILFFAQKSNRNEHNSNDSNSSPTIVSQLYDRRQQEKTVKYNFRQSTFKQVGKNDLGMPIKSIPKWNILKHEMEDNASAIVLSHWVTEAWEDLRLIPSLHDSKIENKRLPRFSIILRNRDNMRRHSMSNFVLMNPNKRLWSWWDRTLKCRRK